MGGLSDLVRKGVRLIVTEADDGSGVSPQPPAGVHVTEIPPEELAVPETAPVAPSDLPSDVADFADVYAEAAIAEPAHGYGIVKVEQMLSNPRLAELDREVKATAVLAALEAAGVTLTEVIQDAVRRDQALDGFEAAKRQELDHLESETQARLSEIEREIQDFLRAKNGEIETLKAHAQAARDAFAALTERKRSEEERLRDLVCHFVAPAENPITAPEPAPAAAPVADPEPPSDPEQSSST